MEQEVKTQFKFVKETDWSTDRDNFAIPMELTVTITLDEYRDLVSCKAKHDYQISEKTNKISELEKQVKELTTQLETMRQTIRVTISQEE